MALCKNCARSGLFLSVDSNGLCGYCAPFVIMDIQQKSRLIQRQKLESVVDGAKMYSQPQALKFLRSLKLMNHSPLREVEKLWFDSIFLWDRISGDLINIALLEVTAEKAGGHTDRVGNYFRCRNCPDSLNRKP